MNKLLELLLGVIIFHIIDRAARAYSAREAERRGLNVLQAEQFRCSVELAAVSVLFVMVLIYAVRKDK